MKSRDFHSWMWSEALSLLDQADRLHRQFFRLGPTAQAHAWEPPVDVIESADGFRVHVALPGVANDAIAVCVEADGVTVSALRAFPDCAPEARLHRVEIPYGRFERRIALPAHALELTERTHANGLLTLVFEKRAGEQDKEPT